MPIQARKCGREDYRIELMQEEREDCNCALKKQNTLFK
jgi:hypothetical protein